MNKQSLAQRNLSPQIQTLVEMLNDPAGVGFGPAWYTRGNSLTGDFADTARQSQKEPSVAQSKTYPALDYLRQLLRDKVPLFSL
jgi:hypothetical protein